MARTNTRGKRRVKKNIAKGVAHVHSTFNNTIVTVTDEHGNVLTWSSAGALGFKVQESLLHMLLKWLLKLLQKHQWIME